MLRQPAVTEYLEAALRAAGVRQAVIAHNIANLNTPGYRRRAVAFEALLAKAIASGSDADPAQIAVQIFQPQNTPTDGNGNDVNLEAEIGEMIKNDGRYKAYVRLLSKLYRQMELAMQG